MNKKHNVPIIYRKGRKKTSPAKITREDIEKAMKEFKGEIQHLTIEKNSLHKSKTDFTAPLNPVMPLKKHEKQ